MAGEAANHRRKQVKALAYTVRALALWGEQGLEKEMISLGVSPQAIHHMADKGKFFLLRADGLSPVAANILKQEMLSCGGEAAVHAGVIVHKVEQSGVLLMGTLLQYERLTEKLCRQQFGLPRLAEEIRTVLAYKTVTRGRTIAYPGGSLRLGERTLLMGIVNVTPDSFSDGGQFYTAANAMDHGMALAAVGADLLDIGGESTRPGAAWVSAEEEMERILPVIAGLTAKTHIPISVDTYKPSVARAALEAGAHILNDVWGMQWEGDPAHEMAAIAGEYGVPIIIMHNQTGTEYKNLLGDMIDFFQRSIEIGLSHGVAREQMILDPGIGFGKTPEQNMEVLARMEELTSLGLPLLLGVSRKSVISYCQQGDNGVPVEERTFGTAAAVTLGIQKGADILRIHDVGALSQAVQVADCILRR